MVELVPLHSIPTDAVERLLDAAFGPDRFGRTAYRLRDGVAMIDALSFGAVDAGVLIGSIQSWPVQLVPDADARAAVPLVMVGPVAVDPAHQGRGLGKRLVEAVLARAENNADGALMMIGDPEYYGRFFGFTADATGGWRLPGPWEPRRLLARACPGHPVPAQSGDIGPRGVTNATGNG